MIEFTYSSLNGLGDTPHEIEIRQLTAQLKSEIDLLGQQIVYAGQRGLVSRVELDSMLSEQERLRQQAARLSTQAMPDSATGLTAHLEQLRQLLIATTALSERVGEMTMGSLVGRRTSRFLGSTAAIVISLGGLGVLTGWVILSRKRRSR